MTDEKEENIKIPRIIFYDQTELVEYFDEENMDVLTDILDGIEQGYDLDLRGTDIFEVEITNIKHIMLFSLFEKDWKRELQNILTIFIKAEEYELAGRTDKLLKKVEERLSSENKSKTNV